MKQQHTPVKQTTYETEQMCTYPDAEPDEQQISSIINSDHIEPFFKLYIFTELMDDSLLDAYERYVHENGHDTMNKRK